MRWDERLVAKAARKAGSRVRQRKARIGRAVADDAPWVEVEEEVGGLRIRAKRLFRLLLERPSLRAALGGWA